MQWRTVVHSILCIKSHNQYSESQSPLSTLLQSPEKRIGVPSKCFGNMFQEHKGEHIFTNVPFLFPCLLRIAPLSYFHIYLWSVTPVKRKITHKKKKYLKSLTTQKEKGLYQMMTWMWIINRLRGTQPPVDGHVDWAHIFCRWKW